MLHSPPPQVHQSIHPWMLFRSHRSVEPFNLPFHLEKAFVTRLSAAIWPLNTLAFKIPRPLRRVSILGVRPYGPVCSSLGEECNKKWARTSQLQQSQPIWLVGTTKERSHLSDKSSKKYEIGHTKVLGLEPVSEQLSTFGSHGNMFLFWFCFFLVGLGVRRRAEM